MSQDEKQLMFLAAVAELIASKKVKLPKTDKKAIQNILNRALSAKRLLPGAKIIRSGRPMTDFMSKVKKKQRRALKGEYLKYRIATVKGPQKALITNARAQVSKPYKKKMITTVTVVTNRVAARVYKMLSKEVGPPSGVKHSGINNFYAQFDAFTLSAKNIDTGKDELELSLHFHDPEDEALTKIHDKILKRLNHFAGVEVDLLDPFN